jgi:hypothetical protein
MGGARGTYGRGEKYAQCFGGKAQMKGKTRKTRGVDVRMG